MSENKLKKLLADCGVEIRFSQNAEKDLKSFNIEIQEIIIAYMIKRAQTGPLIYLEGVGKPLSRELSGFTKIKLKNLSLRIIYRPVTTSKMVLMEIIAIGPRDKNRVYKQAAKRLLDFNQEMD
jgi:mRNA interferase RelE/StbE